MKSSVDIGFVCPSRFTDETKTSRSGFSKGSGLSNTPFTMLKIDVVAPIASASVATAMNVKPGVRASLRIA